MLRHLDYNGSLLLPDSGLWDCVYQYCCFLSRSSFLMYCEPGFVCRLFHFSSPQHQKNNVKIIQFSHEETFTAGMNNVFFPNRLLIKHFSIKWNWKKTKGDSDLWYWDIRCPIWLVIINFSPSKFKIEWKWRKNEGGDKIRQKRIDFQNKRILMLNV